MISCCGLDCSKCEGYLATQADDNEMRALVAKEKKMGSSLRLTLVVN